MEKRIAIVDEAYVEAIGANIQDAIAQLNDAVGHEWMTLEEIEDDKSEEGMAQWHFRVFEISKEIAEELDGDSMSVVFEHGSEVGKLTLYSDRDGQAA